MRPNDTIATLTLADLQQRYQSSWIDYDNQIMFVRNFMEDGEGFKYIERIDEPIALIRFDASKINTERLKSGWYPTITGYGYLMYTEEKQFSRGYQHGSNCFLVSEQVGNKLLPNDVFAELLRSMKQLKIPLPNRSPTSMEGLLNSKRSMRLSPQILWQRSHCRFFYRRRFIAEYFENQICMRDPEFRPELEEVVIGGKYVSA